MSVLSAEAGERQQQPREIPVEDLDFVLTARIAAAWAGELGEEPRLGWWRTDLVSEFGGEDLFPLRRPFTIRGIADRHGILPGLQDPLHGVEEGTDRDACLPKPRHNLFRQANRLVP